MGINDSNKISLEMRSKVKPSKHSKVFKLIVNVLFFLIILWSLYPLIFGDPMAGAPGPAALLKAMIGY